MSDRPRNAADALYPHLRAAVPARPEQQQRGPNDLASVMYPSHVVKQPPLSDPYLAYMQRLGFVRTRGRR
jgi:hypothetical protein